MAYRRTAIRQFSIANSAYRNAVLTFYKVDTSTQQASPVLATVYAAATGTTRAANPYTLDANGKFVVPLYVEEPVIISVSQSAVGSHSTGIIYPDATGFRGDWVSGADYLAGEFVRDGAAGANTGNLYACSVAHTGGTWTTDLAASKWILAIPAASVSLPSGVTGILDIAHGGTNSSNAAAARTALGLGIGSDVQAYSSILDSVAGGTYTGDNSITTLGTVVAGIWQGTAIADGYISSAANWNAKLDGTSALTALGALSFVANSLAYGTGTDTVGLTTLTAFARTLIDDSTAGAALTTLGVSAFMQTVLDDADATAALATMGAAPLASPALTGNPTAPTPTAGDNDTSVATTAYAREMGATYGAYSLYTVNTTLTDSAYGDFHQINTAAVELTLPTISGTTHAGRTITIFGFENGVVKAGGSDKIYWGNRWQNVSQVNVQYFQKVTFMNYAPGIWMVVTEGSGDPSGMPEASIAANGTADLGTTNSANIFLTGGGTTTAFGTAPAGIRKNLRWQGATDIVHNATSLILPGGVGIITAANDTAEALSLGSGNWIITNYKRQSGLPVVMPSGTASQAMISQSTTSHTAYTGSHTVPQDNTLPTTSETEAMLTALTVVPNTATDILEFESQVNYDVLGSGALFFYGLYQDANTTPVLGWTHKDGGNNNPESFSVRGTVISGSTTSRTYTPRAGTVGGTAFYINGDNTGRLFGGAYETRCDCTVRKA